MLENVEQLNKKGLTHDGTVTLATGNSRTSVSWNNKEMDWSEFLSKISQTVRTKETITEYNQMTKAMQADIKDVGGFVGGFLKSKRRQAGNVMNRSMLTLDLDYAEQGIDEDLSMFFENAYALYSTHKHREHSPRVRLVVPLKRHVDSEEYIAVARRVAEQVGINMFDDTTYEPHRLMYWPSTSSDAEFLFRYEDLPFLDPDKVLESYKDWRDPLEWPRSERETARYESLADKQGDPHDKPGLVGAFNRAYDIHEAIEKFLPDKYTQVDGDPNRYTYVDGTTSGGLVLYQDAKFAYSHHATDPAHGILVNSFDIVRLHKFGVRDEDTSEDTPITRMPSYKAMIELAQKDGAVKTNEMVGRLTAQDDFEEIAAEHNIDPEKLKESTMKWIDKVTVNKAGEVEATGPNIIKILENDVNLAGAIKFDEFANRIVIGKPVPWNKDGAGQNWTDADSGALRCYLEDVYKVYHLKKTDDAILAVANNHKYHPVKEYLDPLEWDGVERLDTLFIDYLGSDDNELTRAVTRKAFTGAVARIYEPGCKFDYMVTLYGTQGIGKSTIISTMAGEKFFSESLTSVTGKEAYEALQGTWIIEMAELSAMRKAEVEAIKHFISKRVDSFRAAYARYKEDHKRQCVFFGTTNTIDFLRDETGNRRFWPVDTKKEGGPKSLDDLTNDVVAQLWAEAKVRYNDGEKLYLTREQESQMRERQSFNTEESPKTGMIEEYLKVEIPANWYNLDIDTRRLYIASGGDPSAVVDIDEDGEFMERDKVCALEIWCECLGNDRAKFPRNDYKEIISILNKNPEWEYNTQSKTGKLRFGREYGTQRAYIKV
ncbi:virulence-associated E family protein [Staphylococcus chromogenes]|uniref:virulence-associated E family protein n=1 Tax=Staphylococcus chromogenes TaxID=46126 RepID=UPI00188E39B3|nr:virulence-associated E family protein [Staphylococcus chromogenes]